MKPIAIIQHETGVSAGHFESWLAARSLPYVLVGIHGGDAAGKAWVAFSSKPTAISDVQAFAARPWTRTGSPSW